jgi:BirA family biotin operon repressor/biotin-[acetyl-CoA-carboxylase] ligase
MALDALSATDISRLLADKAISSHEFNVIVEDCVPSTNDHLLELVSTSKEPLCKTAVLAAMQTNGKGRQGRTWVSVKGNILLSLYWPFKGNLEKLYGLSIVVGIAIARVLKANGLSDIQLKWPNDIYWQERKMGGILIETKQNNNGVIDTIIGIGLNIVDMQNYASEINQKIVSLENALQRKIYINQIVAQILIELNSSLQHFEDKGFEPFVEEWKSLDAKIPTNTHELDLIAKILSPEKLKILDKKNHNH